MAKSIFTTFQKTILDGICKEKFITDNFWMAGRTALSDDFDFFTQNEIDLEVASSFSKAENFENSPKIIKKFSKKGMVTFFLLGITRSLF